MHRPKIIIDDRIPYIKGLLDSVADVVYAPYADMTHDLLNDADAIIIRTRTRCDRQLLEDTAVRLIVTATIGMDHIDLDYCSSHRITVRNAPGCNAGSVAQWVGEALTVWENTRAKRAYGTDGIERMYMPKGGVVGIVGLGHVGSKVQAMVEARGYKTIISDPFKGYNSTLLDLAKSCDVITFHTPLTEDGDFPTRGMAGSEFFYNLNPNVFVINAARGGIIVESELKRWAKRYHAAYCAIDCWANEPSIDRELLAMTLIGTPHIAGYSADGKWNGTRMSVVAVNDFFGFNAPLPPPLPVAGGERYNIMNDSEALKNEPEKFEWFRGHYPERRE